MGKGTLIAASALILAVLGGSALAQEADANGYAPGRPDRGDRIERRLDRAGDIVDRRLDRAARRAHDRDQDRLARHLDRRGDVIDRQLDRRGQQIDRRLDRRGRPGGGHPGTARGPRGQR